MELRNIPFDRLTLTAVNMRHARKAPDVSDILPSVRARGILQPLLVRPAGRAFEVVAGRRRYFAAKAVRKEQGRVAPLPCAIMAPGDDAAALEASLIENAHRLDPDPMTQYETFTRLVGEGKTVADIAATFGLTETNVKQRLAIGGLLPAIREAYRDEKIDNETLRYLTMASKKQQQDWWTLFEDAGSHAPRGYQLKQWLFGGQSISTKVARFPLDAYPGHIVADLFGEDGYFADADVFWELQNKAVAEARDGYLAKGWPGVEVLEIGKSFRDWEHIRTAKKKGGKVYIAISHQGEVAIHEGYLPPKEARRAGKKGKGKDDKNADAETPVERPSLSKGLENYLALHRNAAVRLALIAQPRLALRLMLAHTLAASGHWRVTREPQQPHSGEIAASLNASEAQAAFHAERDAVLALLALPEDAESAVSSNGDGYRTAALFRRLLDLSDKDVQRVAAFAMAETLAAGSVMGEALGVHLKVDPRGTWTPDAAFFDLIRDKATINAMLCDVAGKAVADTNVAAKGAAQKQIIRDCLDGANGRAKVANWLPGLMAFPFVAYVDGPSKVGDAAQTAVQVFAAP